MALVDQIRDMILLPIQGDETQRLPSKVQQDRLAVRLVVARLVAEHLPVALLADSMEVVALAADVDNVKEIKKMICVFIIG